MKAQNERVILKVPTQEQITESGLTINDDHSNKYMKATVFDSSVKEYKAGDEVVIPSYSDIFYFKGEEYLIVHYSSIVAKCE